MGQPQEQAPGQLDTARAEELLDSVEGAVRQWTSAASLALLKRAARAREEMEDIWAEAQSLSRGEPR